MILDIPIGDFESEVNNFAADLLKGSSHLTRTNMDIQLFILLVFTTKLIISSYSLHTLPVARILLR